MGNTWRRRARKYGGGFTGFVQGIKDWKNGVGETASILYRAVQCSSLAGQMSKEANKDKDKAPALANKDKQAAIAGMAAGAGGGERAAAGSGGQEGGGGADGSRQGSGGGAASPG